jgi:hypothetical protein
VIPRTTVSRLQQGNPVAYGELASIVDPSLESLEEPVHDRRLSTEAGEDGRVDVAGETRLAPPEARRARQ